MRHSPLYYKQTLLDAFSQQQANVNFLGTFNIRLGKVMFGSLGLLNAFSIQDIYIYIFFYSGYIAPSYIAPS